MSIRTATMWRIYRRPAPCFRGLAFASVIAVLLLGGGCVSNGLSPDEESVQGLTSLQSTKLAKLIVEHVQSDYTGPVDWVWLRNSPVEKFPKLHEAVLDGLQEVYVVYQFEHEIAPNLRKSAPEIGLYGFEGGFALGYYVEINGAEVRVLYSLGVGVNSSSQWIVYRWKGRDWEIAGIESKTVT